MAKEIKFNIKLNIDGKEQIGMVTTDVTKLRRAMEESKTSAQKFRDNILSINQAVTALQNVSGAIGGLRDTMAGLTSTYNAVEQANTQLTTVMRQRMNATDDDIKKVTDLIGAQSKLGVIGGTVQKAGAQQIATFLKEKGTLEQLVPAMNDLLAQHRGLNASQEDARSVANLMGKAMTGQTSALRRVGITFDEAQEKVMKYGTEQQRAAMLAEIITNNVEHMNAKLGETDAGKLKQAEMRFAGIKVQLGELVSKVLPYVSLAAQTLTIASSVVTLGKSIQGVMVVMGNLNLATKAVAVASAGARTAMAGLSAVVRVAQSAFTGATVGATTLKMAFRGLLISTGVGAAIALLSVGVDALVTHLTAGKAAADDLSAAEAESQAAHQQEAQQINNATSAVAMHISKLKEFKGSKAEEKKLVEEMNNTYGSAMGYYSTVAQWYTALTGNSKAYCNQMINEIRIRNLATQAADLQQQQHNIRYDDGKLRKYSKKRETRQVATGQIDAGDGKVLPTYSNVEVKGTSDLEKANAKLSSLHKKEQVITGQMNALTRQNSGTTYKQYAGYSATQPQVTPAPAKTGGKVTGGKSGDTTTEKEFLEGSLDWYEQKMQALRKQMYASNDEATAAGLQAQYEDLEAKSKAMKIRIGLEEPETQEVKTYMEQLQGKLAAAQKELDNATTIEARVAASAKVDEIQAEIDTATKGEVSIKAAVEPTYIQKGSVADKRQSYQNAQSNASQVQQDFEIGIIGEAEAKRQIDEINASIQALGDGMKPIKLDVDTKDMKALKSLFNVDLSNFDSVAGALSNIKGIADPTTKGLAGVGTACSSLGSAMQQLGTDSAGAKAGMVMAAIGQIALSFAQALASCHSWIEWLAFGISGAATMISLISTVNGFATGGIVGGNSTTGDKIPIRVNSGEMILTKAQQARLFAIANGQMTPNINMSKTPTIHVEPSFQTPESEKDSVIKFVLRGDTATAQISNHSRMMQKIGKHTQIAL